MVYKKSICAAGAMMVLFFASRSVLCAEPQVWLVGNMTSAGGYPRTVYDKSELYEITSRIERQPYLWMLNVIQDISEREYDLKNHEKMYESAKGETAKSCAFLYSIGRYYDRVSGKPAPFADEKAARAYADKAANYLLSMYTESRAKGAQPDGDIHSAEELHVWSQAYDLLKGAGYDFIYEGANVESEVVQRLADLTAALYADYMIDNALVLRAYINNHRSKSAAGIGFAAIVLNGSGFESKVSDGRYDINNWVDFSIRYLDLVLDQLITNQENAFEEGGGYYNYSSVDHALFYRAWNLYTKAASYTYQPWSSKVPPYYLVSMTGPYTVKDFWSSSQYQAQLLTQVLMLLPDRTFPPQDDCTPGVGFFWGLFVNSEFSDAPVFRWAWETNPYGLSLPGLGGTAEMIASFDDSIAAVGPDQKPDQVLPVAGDLFFRSSWGNDASVLLISAENGNAAARAITRWGNYFQGMAGHEHNEPGSFMLYNGAEPLAIDSGYLGWEKHWNVNKAINHNILLVDGKGPEDSFLTVPEIKQDRKGNWYPVKPWETGGWTRGADGDGYLLDYHSGSNMDVALVRTSYTKALFGWTRHFVFIEKRYLVIYDSFFAGDGLEHNVVFQLHGNGGEDSGGQFETQEKGGLWTQGHSRLRAAIIGDGEPEYTTRSAVFDKWGWDERRHTVLDAKSGLKAGLNGRFLAVLAVESSKEGAFETTKFNFVTDGIEWESDSATYSAGFAGTGAGSGELKVERVQKTGATKELVSLRIKNSSRSEDAYGFYISQTDDLVEGYSFGVGGAYEIPGVYRSGSGLCGLETGLGKTEITRPGSGTFMLSAQDGVTVSGVAVINCSAADGATPFIPEYPTLRPIRLSGVDSCMDGVGETIYSWNVLNRPELSLAILERTGEAETVLTPDLPGAYTISLEVERGDGKAETRKLIFVAGDAREASDGGPDSGTDASFAKDGGVSDVGAEDSGTADGGSNHDQKDGCGGGCSTMGLLAFASIGQLFALRRRR